MILKNPSLFLGDIHPQKPESFLKAPTPQKKSHHQEFQVPKMEVLNLIFGYFIRGGFYTHFRYLKCLVIPVIP